MAPIPINIADWVGRTPMVQLTRLMPDSPAALFAKLEMFNPGGSVKDRIGVAMIEAAEAEGRIEPGRTTVVEATSGNTGIALAFVCAAKGYDLVLTLPQGMSREREGLLRLYGAQFHITESLGGMDEAVAAAQALARDERSQLAAGLLQHLPRGARLVALRVCGILELARHEGVRHLGQQRLRARHRAAHAVRGGGQHDVRAVSAQDVAALEAHVLRHHQHTAIATHGRDHRETDAGVAARGLDDHGGGLELAGPFGRQDHRQRRTILDATRGVHELDLGHHLGAGGRDAREPHQRRHGDQGQCVIRDAQPRIGESTRRTFSQVIVGRHQPEKLPSPGPPGPTIRAARPRTSSGCTSSKNGAKIRANARVLAASGALVVICPASLPSA